ncbi:MAG: mechanosensitive ion channel family protein [Ruminococcaceae bacterium]|nr:mechanosensitive ion channel family protein [Oscillospiraceae bacterium]
MKIFDSLLQQLVPILVDVLLKLLFAVLVYFIGSKLIKIILKIWQKSKAFAKIDNDAAQFLTSCINISLRILLIATVVIILGIPTSSIIAALGSAGLAIGLALQGGLSNFAGGVILLVTKPFQTGDYICVGSESGTVTSIDIFYTNLTTPDNCSIVIPNGVITNSPIINKSKFDTRRIDLMFSVEYESDIEKVKCVLLNVADKNEFVLKGENKPFATVSAYEDSAIKLLLRVWCKRDSYWDASYSLQEQVKKAFDENSITIPFPQVEITEKKK